MKKWLLRALMALAAAVLLIAGAVALMPRLEGALDVAVFGRRPLPGQWPAARPPEGLAFSVIHTSSTQATPEALVVAGGRWGAQRRPLHAAVLVRHPQGSFLLDTGLGRQVAEQFAVNSAFHRRFFAYDAVLPAVDQLAAHGIPAQEIGRIIPTHMHWDHVSGLKDFPQAQVWVQAKELEQARRGQPPAFIASQFDGDVRWRLFEFTGGAYMGYPASLDLYGDGSVVLVPLGGHTAGQIGMFLALPSGKRLFFIGDTTWAIEGITRPAERPWVVRRVSKVDADEARNREVIVHVHRLMQAFPELVVVPAHDETVAAGLPRFPDFAQ